MKDLLILQRIHKVLLRKAKKTLKKDDGDWREMDAKFFSAIHLNLWDKVIRNVIHKEKDKTILRKLESLYIAKNLTNMRLGHLGEHNMFEIYKRNSLKDLKSCKLGFCKYCLYG
jgi:hypothetical protein